MRLHGPSGGAFALATIFLVALPDAASALGHRHRHPRTPAFGYAAPIQEVYQYPGTIVHQPTSPFGYAVPIQDVFQYPAAIVGQPGSLLPTAVPGWVRPDDSVDFHGR